MGAVVAPARGAAGTVTPVESAGTPAEQVEQPGAAATVATGAATIGEQAVVGQTLWQTWRKVV